MLSKDDIFTIFDKILQNTDDVQLTIGIEEAVFIRYSNSYIHQNSFLKNAVVNVKVMRNNRQANVSVSSLEPKTIKNAIKEARKIAKVSPSIDDLPEFLKESTAKSVEGERKLDFKKCFNLVKKVIKKSGKYPAYGILRSSNVVWALGNSYGLRLYQFTPMDYISIILMNGRQSTFNSFYNLDFDLEEISKMRKKIMFKSEPDSIEPGEYEVILESPAVADILNHMSYISFNAKSVFEKISFFEEGKKVFDDRVTIYDDKDMPSGFPFYFDLDGQERKRLTIIEKGICKEIPCDRFYGKKLGKESTGHSFGEISSSPIPMHLVMEKGDKTLEELISSVDRGIYVSRFHYVNTVKPFDVTLTGMTRYGTFLIKNGKIRKPLKNLRFTQSMVEAFSNIEGISSEVVLHSNSDFYSIPEPSHTFCPSLLIRKFRFNGISDDSKTI